MVSVYPIVIIGYIEIINLTYPPVFIKYQPIENQIDRRIEDGVVRIKKSRKRVDDDSYPGWVWQQCNRKGTDYNTDNYSESLQ